MEKNWEHSQQEAQGTKHDPSGIIKGLTIDDFQVEAWDMPSQETTGNTAAPGDKSSLLSLSEFLLRRMGRDNQTVLVFHQ